MQSPALASLTVKILAHIIGQWERIQGQNITDGLYMYNFFIGFQIQLDPTVKLNIPLDPTI